MSTFNGTDGNDNITGSRRSDVLNGGAGNDILDGSRGNDVLNGGAGDDILRAGYDFGQGDRFNGGEGTDTYVIDGTEVDHFAFDVDLERGTDRYNNEYTGIENIVGGDRGDELSGDAGDNIFDGRQGDDVLNGRDGNDTLRGESGNDVIIGGSFSNEQVQAIADADTGMREEIGQVLGNSDGSSLDPTGETDADQITGGTGEDLLLGGQGNDWIDGGSGDDVIYGNSGDDLISGGDGDDTIYGGKGDDRIADGEGDDTVLGDSGNDWIEAGSGADDTYTGGSGNDTLDYSNSGADGLKIDLSKGTVTGSGHNDTINGFEHVIGSEGNDTIKGSKRAETIDGGSGDDVIRGYKGGDTLTGGEGADTFFWERKDVDDVDTIADFDMSSDTLDFRKLIKSTSFEDASEVVRIEQTDEGSIVSVYSGSDYGWQTVVMLDDVYTDVDQLVDDGSLLL